MKELILRINERLYELQIYCGDVYVYSVVQYPLVSVLR